MAGRVNTRFVFILIAVLVVLVGGIASMAFLASRDAQALVERAEEYMAEGEIKLAVETFERAVGRSKSDPQIIKKFIAAAKQLPAADYVEAGNTLQIVRAYAMNLVQIDPDSEDYLREYAELVKDTVDKIGVTAGSHPLYIYHASVARLEYNSNDKLARRYRGVYGLLQLNVEMSEEDMYLVRDDILWARETYPDDPEVINSLAQWNLFEARLLTRPGGDEDLAQQRKDEAVVLTKELVASDPTNVRLLLEHMQVLYRATVDPSSEDRYFMIKPILDEVELLLLQDPTPPDVVRTVVQNLKLVYSEELVPEDDTLSQATAVNNNEGVRRAIALLKKAIEKYPDEQTYPLLLGVELKQVTEYEQARTCLEQVKGLSTQGNYLDVLLNHRLKTAASIEYADILISLAEKSETDDQQETRYKEAGKIIEDAVASGRGEEPRIQLLKGRLALAQGNVREGLISIDAAAEGYDAFSREKAEALLLSARARAQQGDWGAATERYEQILKANPKIQAIQLTLGGIYIRQREFDTAQDHIDDILVDDPTNERALSLQASLYAAQGDLDQAVETYRQLDMANRPDLAVALAQLLIQGGREDQAAKMLKLYYDRDPKNIQILALLLYSVEDLELKQQLIDRSRSAGGDETALVMLERQMDPDAEVDAGEAIESFLENEPDPFLRAVSSVRLYARAGNLDEARAALDRAEALNPDDRQVLDLRFNFALGDGDYDLAQRLADRAAQLNLDEASGRFYLAQIQARKKEHAAAIETLRIALEEVPINSDGWRLLGEMYIAVRNDSEAVIAFETSLKQRPDNLGAIQGLAGIRDRQGRHDEALEMIEFAHKRYPANPRLQELYLNYEGKYGDMQAALRQRHEIADDQPQNAGNKRALALLLAQTGQHQSGLDMIRGLIDAEGETQINLMVLANVHLSAGDADLGAQVLRRYIQSRGTQATSAEHLMLARYLLKSEDGEGSLASYLKAIELETDAREVSRELAALYFSRQVYAKALPLYRELYSQFPEDRLLGLRLVDSLLRVQQYEEAEGVLDGLGDGATVDAQRALILASQGDQVEAIRLISRAIETEPGKAIFYFERASLLVKELDRTDEVIQDVNMSLSLNPGHRLSRQLLVAMHIRRGEQREAMREMITMVSRHPDYDAGRIALIQMHVRAGDFTRAKTLARAGLALTPDEPSWHTVLGSLAFQEGDIPEAIDSFSTVLEMAPNAGNLLKLTTIQIENGRAAEAQSLLREHAEIVNQQPLLQAVMGRALYAIGKEDQARQVFARSAERCTSANQMFGLAVQVRKDYSLADSISLLEGLSQSPSPVWVDLALARLEVSDGEAQAVIKRLEDLEPTLPEDDVVSRQMLEQIMGPALHNAGRSEEALVYYRRVHEYAPDNTSVLNNMAYLLANDLGRLDEALPLAQRAAELEPNNAQILDTLGWVQFKLGQTDQAQQTLESSIDAESLGANHLHMAELLIEKGYEADANRHLKTAIDLAEQNNDTEILERAQKLLERADELTEASVNP
jgi:tetratricopeptide (TPR) repeat protein